MKEIINLMKFDFIALKKKSFLVYAIIFLGCCVIGFVAFPSCPMFTVMYSGFVVQPIFLMSEQSDFNKFYGIIPVNRRNIVISRFLLTFLTIFVATLLSIGAATVLREISIAPQIGGTCKEFYEMDEIFFNDELSYSVIAAIIFLIGAVLISLEFTMVFIFGPSKEIFASVVGCAGLIAVIIAVFKIFDVNLNDIKEYFGFMIVDRETQFYALIFGLGVLIFVVNIIISCIFFCKKEL